MQKENWKDNASSVDHQNLVYQMRTNQVGQTSKTFRDVVHEYTFLNITHLLTIIKELNDVLHCWKDTKRSTLGHFFFHGLIGYSNKL